MKHYGARMNNSETLGKHIDPSTLVASNDSNEEKTNELNSQLGVHTADLDDIKHIRFLNLHKHLHILKVIDMLFELVKVTQQHRAVSLALLGGFQSYSRKIDEIEADTTRLLKLIGLERKQYTTLIDDNEWNTIVNEWQIVKHQWRQDDALHNFEIHTHLVDQLLTLIWTIFHRSKETTLIKNNLADFEIFILRDLPKLIEVLGQIRGLTTYTSAIGSCETKYHMRLNFLVNEAEAKRMSIETKLGTFQALWKDQFLSNDIVDVIHSHTNELLTTIKQEHLSAGPITVSADTMYEMATRVLNIYLLYAEACLKIFNKHSAPE